MHARNFWSLLIHMNYKQDEEPNHLENYISFMFMHWNYVFYGIRSTECQYKAKEVHWKLHKIESQIDTLIQTV